ncbi:MAG: hypothetical protein AAF772_16535 [Acidobacteriota bacterium]
MFAAFILKNIMVNTVTSDNNRGFMTSRLAALTNISRIVKAIRQCATQVNLESISKNAAEEAFT